MLSVLYIPLGLKIAHGLLTACSGMGPRSMVQWCRVPSGSATVTYKHQHCMHWTRDKDSGIVVLNRVEIQLKTDHLTPAIYLNIYQVSYYHSPPPPRLLEPKKVSSRVKLNYFT